MKDQFSLLMRAFSLGRRNVKDRLAIVMEKLQYDEGKRSLKRYLDIDKTMTLISDGNKHNSVASDLLIIDGGANQTIICNKKMLYDLTPVDM